MYRKCAKFSKMMCLMFKCRVVQDCSGLLMMISSRQAFLRKMEKQKF